MMRTPRFPTTEEQSRSDTATNDVPCTDSPVKDGRVQHLDEPRQIVIRIRIRPRTVFTVAIAFAIGVILGISIESHAINAGIPPETGSSYTSISGLTP